MEIRPDRFKAVAAKNLGKIHRYLLNFLTIAYGLPYFYVNRLLKIAFSICCGNITFIGDIQSPKGQLFVKVTKKKWHFQTM
ncbi:unnamed protein product [Oncorhynchus mykiss]|uniref:Uncharacterized protein n=1 Tax=Oncorhynchus mykiss TaxID=8022 RepID=A0A060Z9F6_ONCMY|nr:unnamed protein product [Oncorhynchus mykiss]